MATTFQWIKRSVSSWPAFGAVVAAALVAAPCQRAAGQAAAGNRGGTAAMSLDQTISRAVAYLQQSQGDDGSFKGTDEPGVSAIVVAALLRVGRTPNDPIVARGLKYLETHVHDDGGIYKDGSRHKNYETCLALVAFQEANKDGRYKDLIARAEKLLKEQQWDEAEGLKISDVNYGGAGYGTATRPDLSNTSFLVDALHAVGRGDDDPALQKALVFISRCQNLESAHNTTEFAAKVNDGGFYYTVAAGGNSMAGREPDGGLRSYGSMTYAGLKSMIYAGVKKDDQRVKAAYDWIKKHYTVTENPGMGEAGLYYYLHTLTKALDAVGEDQLVGSDGASHDWRADVIKQLASTQKPDGSWVNATNRWLEGDPKLVTAYSLLALSYCRPK
ncbi:MAG: prenyltransferase/squalene oxidase repeat-containing protein [Pirellulales bacterium]